MSVSDPARPGDHSVLPLNGEMQSNFLKLSFGLRVAARAKQGSGSADSSIGSAILEETGLSDQWRSGS
jgi:hypothetical protein